MNDKLVNVVARADIAIAETCEILLRKEAFADLNREQYAMLQASYETGKFKYMSEDKCLAELCGLFTVYVEPEDDQILLIAYPLEITNKLSFDCLSGSVAKGF